MPDRLTEQQERAVSCRGASVVLSSGAGCGKTSVLTARYLAHLAADGADVGQLVAITFTDRAAREMRKRIRDAVAAHVRRAGPEEAERWARHLRDLEAAQVCTIHAFCANLLRQHAVEAGLDPRFDVLEDVLSVNFETEALTRCLQDLLTATTPAGEDLRQLVLLYGWKPVVEAVQHLLRGWDERGWQAWREQPVEQAADRWHAYARYTLLPRRVAHLVTASPKIAHCLRLLRRTPPRPGTKMAVNAACLLAELPRLAEADDLEAAIGRLVEAAKVGGERAKAWASEAVYEAARDALQDFREALKEEQLEQLADPPDDLAEAVAVGQRFLCVAGEAARAYRELKQRKGVVDFQDLLLLARDLVRDHAPVRERLRRRYRFLLIDELQDTDPVQMELIRLVCGEALTAGKLFTVGDQKQSIYRFRGADVQLFQALRQQVPAEGRLSLTENFRSQPQVLAFVNALFRDHLADYEPLHAHHPQSNPGPCVEFLWSPRGDKENVTEARSREAAWIARRLAAMIGREASVADPETRALRPVRAGDIVLLFRAMINVQLYEAALREQGLDYYLVGGRAFFAQQEVYDLLNLLRALENPQDAVSLAGTLRSPFCCLSDEALFVLGRHPGGLWAALHDDAVCARVPPEQRDAAARARRCLDRWHSLKDRRPIARLLGAVFADSGYDAAMQFEILADRKLANLWKLQELARTFDRSGLFGLAEFIQRLGDLVRTQPREEQAATQPENADVVRLMSIHQAKGLEFPVVVVPDVGAAGGDARHPVAHWDTELGCVVRPLADEEPPPFPEFGWRLWRANESLADYHEDLRTLYVACTRARDYLILSASLEQPVRPRNTWLLTLADRFDLESGAFLAGEAGEEPPRVRVVARLEAVGDAPAPRPRAEGTAPRPEAAGIDPVPLLVRGKRVFTVAELERWWRSETGFFDEAERSWSSRDVAWQFDAEDGTDRRTWSHPRDGIRLPDGPAALRDRILRVVLERWDYRDPDGWRPLLNTFGAALRHGAESLETWLAHFAASPLREDIAQATTVRHGAEFLLRREAVLRGIVDCLWQDAKGGWHLLDFVTEDVPAEECPAVTEARRMNLAVAASAVHQQIGAAPKDAALYFFADGRTVRWTARQLQVAKALADADAAVSAIARRTLSD
jgi:ATP-dependent helicase/nuclease subunit A